MANTQVYIKDGRSVLLTGGPPGPPQIDIANVVHAKQATKPPMNQHHRISGPNYVKDPYISSLACWPTVGEVEELEIEDGDLCFEAVWPGSGVYCGGMAAPVEADMMVSWTARIVSCRDHAHVMWTPAYVIRNLEEVPDFECDAVVSRSKSTGDTARLYVVSDSLGMVEVKIQRLCCTRDYASRHHPHYAARCRIHAMVPGQIGVNDGLHALTSTDPSIGHGHHCLCISNGLHAVLGDGVFIEGGVAHVTGKDCTHAHACDDGTQTQYQWAQPWGVRYVQKWVRSVDIMHCQCMAGYPDMTEGAWLLSEQPKPNCIDVNLYHRCDPQEETGHTYFFTVKKAGYGHESVFATLFQRNPATDEETEICQFDVLASDQWTQVMHEMDEAEIANIVDYGNLMLRIVNPHPTSEAIYVGQACLRLPMGYIMRFHGYPLDCAHTSGCGCPGFSLRHNIDIHDCLHIHPIWDAFVAENPHPIAGSTHAHVCEVPGMVNYHAVTPDDCDHRFQWNQQIPIQNASQRIDSYKENPYMGWIYYYQWITDGNHAHTAGIATIYYDEAL